MHIHSMRNACPCPASSIACCLVAAPPFLLLFVFPPFVTGARQRRHLQQVAGCVDGVLCRRRGDRRVGAGSARHHASWLHVQCPRGNAGRGIFLLKTAHKKPARDPPRPSACFVHCFLDRSHTKSLVSMVLPTCGKGSLCQPSRRPGGPYYVWSQMGFMSSTRAMLSVQGMSCASCVAGASLVLVVFFLRAGRHTNSGHP